MSAAVNLVENDTGPDLTIAITDTATGLPLDLTTMVSAKMTFRAINTVVVITTPTLTVSGAPTLGLLLLTPTAAMTATPGQFEGQVELTFPASKVVSGFSPIRFNIAADFG